jgi:hypothetical protein
MVLLHSQMQRPHFTQMQPVMRLLHKQMQPVMGPHYTQMQLVMGSPYKLVQPVSYYKLLFVP